MRTPHSKTLVLGALVAAALIAPTGTATATTTATTAPAPAHADSRTAGAAGRPVLPASVTVDTPVTATGHVPGHRRPVQLQQQFATGWKKVARTYATRSGNVTFAVNTSWYGSHRFRLFAPKFHHKKKWVSKASWNTVTPTYNPVGSAASYQLAGRARWNPCKPIRWVYVPASTATHPPVSGDGATFSDIDAHAFAAVSEALAEVTRATGVRFSYAGRGTFAGRVGTLEVGWVDQPQQAGMATGQDGVGGFSAGRSRTGVPEIARGSAIMNAEKLYADMDELANSPADFDQVAYLWEKWRAVAMHEVAHAFGVAHVNDDSQLMNPILDATMFGAGDLAGLRLKGAQMGCIPGSRR